MESRVSQGQELLFFAQPGCFTQQIPVIPAEECQRIVSLNLSVGVKGQQKEGAADSDHARETRLKLRHQLRRYSGVC